MEVREGGRKIKIALMAIYRLPLAVMDAKSGDSYGDKRALKPGVGAACWREKSVTCGGTMAAVMAM